MMMPVVMFIMVLVVVAVFVVMIVVAIVWEWGTAVEVLGRLKRVS